MIKISKGQLSLLNDGADFLYLIKIKNILADEYSNLIKDITESDLLPLLNEYLTLARGYFIESEKGAFDFILICLEFGENVLHDERLGIDIEWLESEFVPANSKISAVQESIAHMVDNDEVF